MNNKMTQPMEPDARMTDEEMNIAICELRGWKRREEYDWMVADRWRRAWVDSKNYITAEDELPDHINGIEALGNMHEAEKTLGANERQDYVRALCTVMDGWSMMPDFTTTFATARQRATAFLKTKGLYK